MSSLSERVAHAALDTFAQLPQKCKPRTSPSGVKEWTPLSAIVAVRGVDKDIVKCVSLATGTKCIPVSALAGARGTVVHDSHAEVLALRAFTRWIMQEILFLLETSSHESHYLIRVPDASELPYRLREDVGFHFFTTEAPCGDASMELLMASKGPEGSIPWNTGTDDVHDPTLLGRGQFSILGAVRRKPARADAESSLSKSCSDKLAMRQVTSLLSFPARSFVEQTASVFIASLTVYGDQFDGTGYSRAFGPTGRMKDVTDTHFFEIHRLPENYSRFEYEKHPLRKSKASNVSAVWIRASGHTLDHTIEVLLNGVKQGFKQTDSNMRKESLVCRKKLWLLGRDCASHLDGHVLSQKFACYVDAKNKAAPVSYSVRKVAARQGLGGWPVNLGDDSWSIL
jgi:tRNA-specific adenosine deaminase 1